MARVLLIVTAAMMAVGLAGLAVTMNRDPCDEMRRLCQEAARDPTQLKEQTACAMIGLRGMVHEFKRSECVDIVELFHSRK